MALTGKKLLAVDWDKNDLRMAMVRLKGGRVELLKAVSVPLPGDLAIDNAEMLGAFIREAMRQSGLNARHALMAIPRDQVVLNSLNLPPLSVDDMPAAILFQVLKELPFSAEQAAIDFAVPGGHDPKSGCAALVAAIRVEELAFYRNVAKEAGLTLERVGLRPYSNRRAILASVPELREATVLVVEVGPYLTEINILERGALSFSRSALVPLPRLNQRDRDNVLDSRISMIPPLDAEEDDVTREAVGKLMVDVIRSYEAHRATSPRTSVDQIMVCGSTGLEMELAHSLSARFAAKAQLFTPDRALDLSPQRAKELRGFSAVLGMAMGHEKAPIENFDFLRPKKPVSKRLKRLRKAPIAAGIGVLVVGFGIWGHVNFVLPARADAEKIRKQVAALQSIEKPYKEFIKQVEALQDWKSSEQYWPEVLVRITQVFPSDLQASVDRIDLKVMNVGRTNLRDAFLSLKLRVAEAGTINAISESFRAMGWPKVEPGPETPRAVRGGDETYRFDTGLQATLPMREPRNWEDDAGDSEGMEDNAEAIDDAPAPDSAPAGENDSASTESPEVRP